MMPPNRHPWSLPDFDIVSKAGEGRFGKIYVARERTSGFPVALKCIAKSAIIAHDLKHQLQREIQLQARCRHRHVTQLYAFFWDADTVYLVLELAEGGDLYATLCAAPGGRLAEPTVAHIAAELASALDYLHARGVIHRDVKPDNILLSRRGHIKLCDFSWAVYCASTAERRQTICGTLDYLSPEVVSSRPYDSSVDDWSIGVVIFELLTGRPPFDRALPAETCVCIARGEFEIPAFVSDHAKDCIQRLLQVDHACRMTAGDVLHHAWITSHVPSSTITTLTTHHNNKKRCVVDRSDPIVTGETTGSPRVALHRDREGERRHHGGTAGTLPMGTARTVEATKTPQSASPAVFDARAHLTLQGLSAVVSPMGVSRAGGTLAEEVSRVLDLGGGGHHARRAL